MHGTLAARWRSRRGLTRFSPNTVDLGSDRLGGAFAAKEHSRTSHPPVEGTRVQTVVFAVSDASPAAGSPGLDLLQPGGDAAGRCGGLVRSPLGPPLRQSSRRGLELWHADRSDDANVLL